MTDTRDSDERVMSSIQRLVSALQDQRFYGTAEPKFEARSVVLVRKTETLKPDGYRGNRDSENADHQF
jgi:hypothetical protein